MRVNIESEQTPNQVIHDVLLRTENFMNKLTRGGVFYHKKVQGPSRQLFHISYQGEIRVVGDKYKPENGETEVPESYFENGAPLRVTFQGSDGKIYQEFHTHDKPDVYVDGYPAVLREVK